MNFPVKLGAGLFFFLLGLGYLYRPDLISRVIAIIRDYVLNDAHIALERRKWGLFFLLVSLFFMYLSYADMLRQ